MIRGKIPCAALGFALLLLTPWSAPAATIVYDSLSGALSSGGVLAGENGQSMTLAAGGRQITRIDLRMSSSNNAENYTVQFYNIDSSGLPTILLWASPVQTWTDSTPFAATHIVTVNVPQVLVPDSFAWTVRRILPSQLLLSTSDLPSVGTQITAFFMNDSGVWTAERTNNFAFGATIFAVPEPETALLFIAGALLVSTSIRCRFEGCKEQPLSFPLPAIM